VEEPEFREINEIPEESDNESEDEEESPKTRKTTTKKTITKKITTKKVTTIKVSATKKSTTTKSTKTKTTLNQSPTTKNREINDIPPEDDNESEDDEEEETLPISKDGRCGKGIGRCKDGECCSKYGWCGRSKTHCSIDEGCNPDYGTCNKNTHTITVTKFATKTKNNGNSKPSRNPWQCGKGIGSCPDGYCCSKYGWCGKSDAYCKLEEGCQSKFGVCHEKQVSTSNDDISSTDGTASNDEDDDEWRCGEGYGSCKEGYCCSKYGWCGKSSNYCSKSRGCQSEFGKCWWFQNNLRAKIK